MQAVSAWQAYISEFRHDTFREGGLEKIFGLTNATQPAGKYWTRDDFDRFGKLGIGLGGFGAFHDVYFLTLLRYVTNSCETYLVCLAQYVGGEQQTTGIRSLWQSVWESATKRGLTYLLNTKQQVCRNAQSPWGLSLLFGLSPCEAFDELFINVTVSVANKGLDLGCKGPDQLFPDSTCEPFENMHMILSTKITIQVPRSLLFNDPAFPWTLITDVDLPQVFCFEYSDPETVIVMLAYAWEEDSRRLRSDKDPAKLFAHLKHFATEATVKSPCPQWADIIQPVGDIVLTHWQEDLCALGAFAFAEQGQDQHGAAPFHDFEKDGHI
ncbi:hypothetical protein CPB97_004288 [Podila verticillata]|nr:hypothetical protein CPB97_004288 [Podila verticillata]